ncbi:MAG: DNA-binding protein [Betaproteobacteria bacterium]|nr:DNA-binding protein [Betaproteobacteria bacterium]
MTEQPAVREIPEPPVNPENRPYFEACAQGRLLIGRCNDCGQHHFYPRVICPSCFSNRTEWIPSEGTGTIYTYSTMHRGTPVPYTVAYVTLDEGVTMLTNLVDCDPARLAIGQRVRVVFAKTVAGTSVPMFTPA